MRFVVGVYLAAAGIMDWKKQRVSWKLSLVFGGLGALAWIFFPAFDWVLLAGGILVGICLLGVSKITGEALGYGDGVAVAVTGSYLGFWENVELLFGALLLAALISAVLLLTGRAGRKTRLPFVPFLFTAHVMLTWLGWRAGL